MKKTFKLKLDTELTIDFNARKLSDAEQKGGLETKKLLIQQFLDEDRLDEFKIADKNGVNLIEAIEEVVSAQKSFLKPLVVHASECYKLMTNPQRKSNELSETTKTWLKEKAVEEVLGLRKMIATKPMIKGTLCKNKSIDLYNTVMLTDYKKNSITKNINGFIGTPDLLTDERIVEIKTSWVATTFPFFKDEAHKQVKKCGYDWQCRVYMMLFGIDKAVVCYCLVDTPEVTPDGVWLLNKGDDHTLHIFEGKVREQKRVSISKTIKRDKSIEQKMLERYQIANQYYQNYLEEIYYK